MGPNAIAERLQRVESGPMQRIELKDEVQNHARSAQEVAEAVKPTWCGLDRDQWGLDHGTWSVLAHVYPAADIPVLQLSINALKPLDYRIDLGAKLVALQDKGIMVIASGNVVHNLGRVQWDNPDEAFDWAERFDDAVLSQLAGESGDILRVIAA